MEADYDSTAARHLGDGKTMTLRLAHMSRIRKHPRFDGREIGRWPYWASMAWIRLLYTIEDELPVLVFR
jgi:hypothetical protein